MPPSNNTPPLNKMFTVAADSEGDEDGACNLLFCDIAQNAEPVTREGMYRVVNDPLFKEYMDGGGILTKISDSPPTLLATNNTRYYAIARMGLSDPDESILIFQPGEAIKEINLHEAFYTCTLPHKIIVGCETCNAVDASRICPVRALALRQDEADVNTTAGDAACELRSRKDSIAGYTYVSPKLTAIKNFAKTYREVEAHDFEEVEDRSAIIRQGLQERGRYRRFKKTACANCLVQKGCHNVQCSQDIKYCTGPYIGSEAEAVKTVLAQGEIPFSDKELRYLLVNSGPLRVRYNRCIYWTTFSFHRRTLQFGLSRYTQGDFIPIPTFKEAREIIQNYSRERQETEMPPLTPLRKALLLELASKYYSPVQVSRWHKTQYSVLGVTYDRYSGKLRLNFKFNSYGGPHSYRPDGLLLPWGVSAANFDDIFEEYTMFDNLQQVYHEDSYRKIHGY